MAHTGHTLQITLAGFNNSGPMATLVEALSSGGAAPGDGGGGGGGGSGGDCNDNATLAGKLFDAMDSNGNGELTKFEFIEFMREHKPKHGMWSSVAKLQKELGLDRNPFINREQFREGYVRTWARRSSLKRCSDVPWLCVEALCQIALLPVGRSFAPGLASPLCL